MFHKCCIRYVTKTLSFFFISVLSVKYGHNVRYCTWYSTKLQVTVLCCGSALAITFLKLEHFKGCQELYVYINKFRIGM